ncbi:MAG TPA: dUTP diphosphatase [Candidatus Paceibacterota bacterium]|nr:dUTP diphosphatase [Candidatus Paceibacterota bacterium]
MAKKVVKKRYNENVSFNSNILKVMKLSKTAELPEYALECDVAFDIRSNESKELKPFEQEAIRTGIAIEIPKGYIGLIRDRAGIVTKLGVHAIAGTFDENYRKEVTIFLINFSDDPIFIERGMRIAQMILVPINKVKIVEVKNLSETQRSDREIGSTGMNELLSELNMIASQGEKNLRKKKH